MRIALTTDEHALELADRRHLRRVPQLAHLYLGRHALLMVGPQLHAACTEADLSLAIIGITIGYANLIARMKNYERRLIKTLAASPHPAAYSSIQETSGAAPVKEEV